MLSLILVEKLYTKYPLFKTRDLISIFKTHLHTACNVSNTRCDLTRLPSLGLKSYLACLRHIMMVTNRSICATHTRTRVCTRGLRSGPPPPSHSPPTTTHPCDVTQQRGARVNHDQTCNSFNWITLPRPFIWKVKQQKKQKKRVRVFAAGQDGGLTRTR